MATTTSTSTPTLPIATPRQRVWRRLLILGGLAVMAVGGLVLIMDVKPAAYLGILVWFAGALIIHDGIVGPIVFGIAIIMRKWGRGIPVVVLAIVQGALVVAAIVAALVLPAAYKKNGGTANPTILPLDYLNNLAAFYFALAVVTVGTVVVYLLVTIRREKRRPAVDQD
ncbi:hypothetical protein BH11ACT3_BH11ACT3_21420 [soil metagenome]